MSLYIQASFFNSLHQNLSTQTQRILSQNKGICKGHNSMSGTRL